MPVRVVRYEETPNPNALKCVLDVRLSAAPKSFLNAQMAADDPLATRLFDEAGLTNVYINGDWMTISRAPGAEWNAVKKKVEHVLAEWEA